MSLALNRSEAFDNAAQLACGGALDAALAEYLRLFQKDPRNRGAAEAAGAVCLRLGKQKEAVAHVVAVAEHVALAGDVSKARALYEKVLRIEPCDAVARAASTRSSSRSPAGVPRPAPRPPR